MMTHPTARKVPAAGSHRRGRRSLLLRLALRDIRRNLTRFILVALVIMITVGAGAAVDTLLRSAQVGDLKYAQLSLGDVASARVQWYGDQPAQQTPRADAGQGGGGDAPVAEVEAQLRALLPSGTDLVETRSGVLALRSGTSLTDGVSALEGPFTDPALAGVLDIWQGRLPTAAGEVSLSRTVANRLDLNVGDVFEGGTGASLASLVLVGVHQNNPLGADVALADGSVLAGEATYLAGVPTVWFVAGPALGWPPVLALNDAGFVAISRAVILNPPPLTEVPMYVDGAAAEADIRLGVAIFATGAALIGGTIVALLIGPVIVIGARQSRRDYGLFAAQGATGQDITGIMLRSTLITALAGSVTGALLGVTTAAAVVFASRATGSTAFLNLIVPRGDLVLLGAFGILVALIAAWGPARRAGREDPVASLGDTADPPGSAPRSRWVLMIVLTGIALALVVLVAVTGTRAWLLLVGPLATIALILAIRVLLPRLGRLARSVATPERIAIRDAVRRADRTIPTITGITAAVALAVGISVVTATQYATAAAEWHPRAAAGTIMIYDVSYIESSGSDNPFEKARSETEAGSQPTITTGEQRTQIAETIDEFLPGTELVNVEMLSLDGDSFPRLLINPDTECPNWADSIVQKNQHNGLPPDPTARADVNGMDCEIDKALSDINYQPSWNSPDHTNLVVDDGTLVSALGLPGAEKAATALRSGKIVLTRPIDAWPDGTAHLGIMEDDHDALAKWRDRVQNSDEPVYDNPPEPVTTDTLVADTVIVDWPSRQWKAFIPPQLLTQAPLADHNPKVEHVGMISTATAALSQTELDALRDRLLLHGVHQVTAARDYANDGLATTLTIITMLAALIAITATAGTARIALNDMRRDLRILHDVGAPPSSHRRIRLTTTLTAGVFGSATGIVAGIVLGVTAAAGIASSYSVEKGIWTLAVPWIPILVIAIATPLAAAVLTTIQKDKDANA